MSGFYAKINKEIDAINNMVDLYGLKQLRVVTPVDKDGHIEQGTQEEISEKILLLSKEIAECDRVIGKISSKLLPSSELTKQRGQWQKKHDDLVQTKKRMRTVLSEEVDILGEK